MSNLGVTCLVASALILSPAVFAAQTSQVRIETGAQLVAACQTYLTKSAKESENVVVPVDPCRAYLAGFAAAYGVGQSKNLELRVSGAAPTPPPPREIDVAPWRKPGSGGTKEAPAAPKEEKLPCFVLPSYLSYADFAKLVIAFVSAHAEYGTKPAYIATAAALAEKYPCK